MYVKARIEEKLYTKNIVIVEEKILLLSQSNLESNFTLINWHVF